MFDWVRVAATLACTAGICGLLAVVVHWPLIVGGALMAVCLVVLGHGLAAVLLECWDHRKLVRKEDQK